MRGHKRLLAFKDNHEHGWASIMEKLDALGR